MVAVQIEWSSREQSDGLHKSSRVARAAIFSERIAMTPTVAELLTQEQRLLERLQAEHRLNEQDEIERLLVSINTMLNSLDETPMETRMRH
jgi:hypothetical protein